MTVEERIEIQSQRALADLSRGYFGVPKIRRLLRQLKEHSDEVKNLIEERENELSSEN